MKHAKCGGTAFSAMTEAACRAHHSQLTAIDSDLHREHALHWRVAIPQIGGYCFWNTHRRPLSPFFNLGTLASGGHQAPVYLFPPRRLWTLSHHPVDCPIVVSSRLRSSMADCVLESRLVSRIGRNRTARVVRKASSLLGGRCAVLFPASAFLRKLSKIHQPQSQAGV